VVFVGTLVMACSSNEAAPLDDEGSPSDEGKQEEAPAGDDHGDGEPLPVAMTPMDAGVDAGPMDASIPMKGPLLKSGLHPAASDALRALGVTQARIVQTIGNAAASGGTHAQDGTANNLPYSAATDISIKGMTEEQIKKFIDDLGRMGFAGWYRKPGYDGWPATEAPHVHAIWTGCVMKLKLRDQVRDWLVGKNGLLSHTPYKFYVWPTTSIDLVRAQYLKVNPAAG
jgi:hypothetical protein